jgi:hypothetical protein
MFGQARPKLSLEERVVQSAENTLHHQDYVSPIDILEQMGMVPESSIKRWRNGGVETLEEVLQAGRDKIERSLSIFHLWAEERGMQPMPGRYVRATRDGERALRFTGEKLDGLEEQFHTHYVSPQLPERKRRTLVERQERPPERVVYWNLRDSTCSECGAEIESGRFLFLDAGQPLCLPCANLGELVFLPSGDTALTRRATKYSGARVVVVKFSRSRKRYERQGILVSEAALRQAEEDCVGDAAQRAAARELAAVARKKEDVVLIAEMAVKIRELFPGCPEAEARRIAAHTAERGSGRVGRSAAGRRLDSKALTLAVAAALRHNQTNYDELLAQGVERDVARAKVRGKVDDILERWSGT